MNKENKTCTRIRRRSAEDLNRQLLYEVAEQALESLVEEGEMEKFFCPEDGKTYYRLRQRGGAQEVSCAPAETRQHQNHARLSGPERRNK
jgi:hypothetical protein